MVTVAEADQLDADLADLAAVVAPRERIGEEEHRSLVLTKVRGDEVWARSAGARRRQAARQREALALEALELAMALNAPLGDGDAHGE